MLIVRYTHILFLGFVPFWIAFAVGGTLLEIVSQSGSTGAFGLTVFYSTRCTIPFVCEKIMHNEH